jgi:acetyl esterase/lipase
MGVGVRAYEIALTFWRLAARGQKVDALNSRRFMDNLVGAGDPSRQLKMANLASPIACISAKCPLTLIFHGVHDTLVPVEDSRALYKKLTEAGVPTVYVEFPQTEHAFDFFAQSISPPFQNAVYHLDRFIASVS